MSRLTSLLAGIGAAASLGACASMPGPDGAKPVATAADRHHIDVSEQNARLEVDVAANSGALTPEARDSIAAFASGYLRYGHGALVMSTPSGVSNGDAAATVAQATRGALVDDGVSYAAVAGSTYDATGQATAPVILSFTRYEAEAPQCAPLWEQDLAHQSNNQPWESFGCATQANLAAMVEDPHDLIAPRDMTARDSGRRDTVMDIYRAGHATGAERSPDERVTISSVASQ